MGEGRNLAFEIEKNATRKAIQGSAIVVLFGIISLLLVCICGKYSPLSFAICIIAIIILSILCFVLLKKNYREEGRSKLISELVERQVPVTDYVEVVPTEENNCKDFMEKEREKGFAKFYAIRNERHNIIEIVVKFTGEDEMYPFSAVSKRKFRDYYFTV